MLKAANAKTTFLLNTTISYEAYAVQAIQFIKKGLPEPCKEASEDKLACFAELNAKMHEFVKNAVDNRFDFILDVGLINSSFVSGSTQRKNNLSNGYFALGDLMFQFMFFAEK